MLLFDLIDKELKDYYIKAPKCVFIISVIVQVFLGVLSLFFDTAGVFFIISLVFSLILLFIWRTHKCKYGNTLSYSDTIITVYDYKGLKLIDLEVCMVKNKYINVAFDEYPRHKHRKCLVLYIESEPYDGMEYSSFLDCSEFVIIQNPQLFNIICKLQENT